MKAWLAAHWVPGALLTAIALLLPAPPFVGAFGWPVVFAIHAASVVRVARRASTLRTLARAS